MYCFLIITKIIILHLEKVQSIATSSPYSEKKLGMIYLFAFSPSKGFSIERLRFKVTENMNRTVVMVVKIAQFPPDLFQIISSCSFVLNEQYK